MEKKAKNTLGKMFRAYFRNLLEMYSISHMNGPRAVC